MKTNINSYEFRDAMVKLGFSYHGATALFDYLEQYEEDTGEQLDFDPIAFNCDYTEYESEKELLSQYDSCDTLEDIEDNTTLIKFKKEDYFSKSPDILIEERYIIKNF